MSAAIKSKPIDSPPVEADTEEGASSHFDDGETAACWHRWVDGRYCEHCGQLKED